MSGIDAIKRTLVIFPVVTTALFCLVNGCSRVPAAEDTVQGYVEGEFVYISAPLPGKLATLFVQRGTRVKTGDPLFELENVSEKAARDETGLRLAQIRAQVADAKKGKRPTEIEATTSQLNLARVALQLFGKRAGPSGETAGGQGCSAAGSRAVPLPARSGSAACGPAGGRTRHGKTRAEG